MKIENGYFKLATMGQETSNQAGYKRLIVWNKANILTIEIYKVTKDFPKEELFGLTSQMRRCAVSVPANIVEGYTRRSDKEKLNFFNISRASLAELEYYIDLSFQLNYISENNYKKLLEARAEVGKLLNGFIKSF